MAKGTVLLLHNIMWTIQGGLCSAMDSPPPPLDPINRGGPIRVLQNDHALVNSILYNCHMHLVILCTGKPSSVVLFPTCRLAIGATQSIKYMEMCMTVTVWW